MEYVYWLLYSLGYLITGVLLLFIAKKIFDLLSSFSLDRQLTEKDNPAIGIVITGYLLGIVAILCSTFNGETIEPTLNQFTTEIVPVLIFAFIGMALLFIAGLLNDKVVLRKFSNQQEIIERRNSAVATVVAATYIGSGLIIAGSIQSTDVYVNLLINFALGQIALIIFAFIYQAITHFDDQKELGEQNNLAAGLGYAGNLIAYSLILMKGLTMNEEGLVTWSDRLTHFAYYALAGCALLFLSRLITDRIFLPKSSLAKEIERDQNLCAGLLEGGLALAMGAILVFSL